MKRNVFTAVAMLILAAIACKPAEKEEAVAMPSSLFNAMVVQFPVSDYAKWKMHFMEGDSMRTANNIKNIGYGRGMEDTNTVIVIHEITDLNHGRSFITSPEIKTAMDSAGVTGPPTINFVNVIRNDSSTTDIRERIMIKHSFADFGTFLKVYDGEGVETRKSHGLIDRAMSIGLDDTTAVYLVFAISDMEKAKARMQSEELKKLMADAGMVGEPKFFMYRFDYLKE